MFKIIYHDEPEESLKGLLPKNNPPAALLLFYLLFFFSLNATFIEGSNTEGSVLSFLASSSLLEFKDE